MLQHITFSTKIYIFANPDILDLKFNRVSSNVTPVAVMVCPTLDM